MPARVTTGAVTSGVFVAGRNYAAVSADGCTVRVTGDSDSDGGVVNSSGRGKEKSKFAKLDQPQDVLVEFPHRAVLAEVIE